jgi:surface protein
MYRVFYNCDNITSLDLTDWDISGTSGIMNQCFASMNKLETLDISGWDVSAATSANSMFEYTGAATGIVITANNLNWTNATTFSRAFYVTKATSLILNNWTFKTGASLSQMFRSLSYNSFIGQVELDLSTWNVSNVGNMASMFFNAKGLKNLNVTNWDISSVTNLVSWLISCTSIEKIIGLNTLRADALVSLTGAFKSCHKLSFTTDNFHDDFSVNSNLIQTNETFYEVGKNLAEADRGAFPNVTNWNMQSVTNVYAMFRRSEFANGSTTNPSWNLASFSGSLGLLYYECLGLSEIDWTNVTLKASSGVTDMTNFSGRGNVNNTYLTSVKFGANCNFQDVGRWNYSFRNNINMTTLQFDSSVNFSSVTQMTDMLRSVPLDTQYYDALLVGLDATNNNNSVSLNASVCNYTLGSSAETSRIQLVTNQLWTITDAGGV